MSPQELVKRGQAERKLVKTNELIAKVFDPKAPRSSELKD
jgi:hypothetical protein